MFSCDTIWCCWMDLMHEIGHLLYMARWVALGYAVAYAVGAGIFLLSLRIKSVNGTLTVDTKSLAYAIACPLRYGGHRAKHEGGSSICLFYVRLFHMLLFVWPFLLLYFIIALILGNLFGVLIGNWYMTPNLHEDLFMDSHDLWPIYAGLITVPGFVVALLIINHTKVLYAMRIVGWAAACLIPVLVAIAVGTLLVFKVRNDDEGAMSVAREALLSKKERFCKMIQYR